MDYLTNLGKNVGGDLLDSAGNVGKAFLMVRDVRFERPDREGDAVNLLKKLMAAQESKINSTSSFANLGFSDAKKLAENSGFLPIEVQYNPSSIRFKASTGGARRNYSGREGIGSAGDSMVSNQMVAKHVTMSCKLIFETINVNDAFSFPSENPIPASFGQAVSLGADIVKKAKNNWGADGLAETYSVRKYAEGFVALLAAYKMHDVIFYWGKTCFHGRLTVVNASYKMFNNAGDPIYAEVDISIRQDKKSEGDTKPIYDEEDAIWRKQLEKAFSGNKNAGLGAIDQLKAGYEKYRGIL